MKKIGLFILGLCSIFLAGNFTQAKDYEYTNLDITANILVDGTIDIKEIFTADFFVSKHGIIRDIPLNYSVGGKDFHIEVSNINVQGKTYSTSQNNGNIEIKIGDANKTIIGKQNYPISYSTYGLIRNFSGMGYAELYWNLVGYEFDTNINKVRAELILPKAYTGFTKDDFLITTDGKSKTVDGFEGRVDRSKGDKIIITYDKGLSAKHGITLAIKFPNNYFTFDHKRQEKLIGHTKGFNMKTSNNNHIGRIFGIIIFTSLSVILFKKFYHTDDGKINLNKGKLRGIMAKEFPVIIQYNPPEGLNCAEVGLLLHRQGKAKDMLSLIYKWACDKIICIENIKSTASELDNTGDSIKLSKIKDIPCSYPQYEIKFFDSIFMDNEIIINEDTNLYKDLHLTSLEEYGIENGWLKKSGIGMLGCYWLILLFLSSFVFPLFGGVGHLIYMILFFSTFIIIPIISLASKKLDETTAGAKLISHILGYRKFLANCDENKLRLFLKEDPLYFDKILPYAIVFGLETELMVKIKPIMDEMNIKSSRYSGDFILLSDSISTMSSIASHSSGLSSSSYDSDSGWDSGSSFDSGGSSFDSGGGGGGGGGSSW